MVAVLAEDLFSEYIGGPLEVLPSSVVVANASKDSASSASAKARISLTAFSRRSEASFKGIIMLAYKTPRVVRK